MIGISVIKFKKKFLFCISYSIDENNNARNDRRNSAMNAIMHFHIDSFHRPRASYGFIITLSLPKRQREAQELCILIG